MQTLTQQKCFNHHMREAAARCPECGRNFCRECVTEHKGRVLCASCINSLLAPSKEKKARFNRLKQIFLFLAGITVTWLFFYYLGRILLSLPSSFHEGTLWTG
ncbi:MAG: rhomboid family protein [Desulfobacterales bacterium]|nr:rhomboid family protein [Desulfobacterales bacterium]